MKGDRLSADSVDQEQVGAQMTLRESDPIDTAFVEAMLAERVR